jgi:hypothetical protein
MLGPRPATCTDEKRSVIALSAAPVPGMCFAPIVRFKK